MLNLGLKLKLGISYAEAAYLLEKIKQIYPIYFKWIDGVIKAAVARGYFETVLIIVSKISFLVIKGTSVKSSLKLSIILSKIGSSDIFNLNF